MNPQNYNQVPQGRPAPQGYGANASARAMNAAQATARPLNINQVSATQNTPTPYQQPSTRQPLAPTQSQPASYPGTNIMPPPNLLNPKLKLLLFPPKLTTSTPLSPPRSSLNQPRTTCHTGRQHSKSYRKPYFYPIHLLFL